MRITRLHLIGLLLVALAGLPGCYYLQAARGQLAVNHARTPIAELLHDPRTDPALVARLQVILEARRFAVDELHLPDNESYASYVKLDRDYVVWNVFAAPEFSLESLKWCYPIAGCVSYRGYFNKASADKKAAKLSGKGYDVAVGGAAAYSTLGHFDDPVLSSMLRWDDTQLVGTLFHELAHQRLYVKGDTKFNESFATTVEEFGTSRWLQARGETGQLAKLQAQHAQQQRIKSLLTAARHDLQTYYHESLDDDEKRLLKEHRFDKLAADVRTLLNLPKDDSSNWLTDHPNNATLVPMALYEGWVPAFQALLARCSNAMPCFYAQAEALAKLDKSNRDALLDSLSGSPVAARPVAQ